MKLIICFYAERVLLERLGYKSTRILGYEVNKQIYKMIIDTNSVSLLIQSRLFEPIYICATESELIQLRRKGKVRRLFKVKRDRMIVLFLKPLCEAIPNVLLPYLDSEAIYLRHHASATARSGLMTDENV